MFNFIENWLGITKLKNNNTCLAIQVDRLNAVCEAQRRKLDKSCQYVSDNRVHRVTGYTGRLLLGALIECSNRKTVIVVAHRQNYCRDLMYSTLRLSETAFGGGNHLGRIERDTFVMVTGGRIIFTTENNLETVKRSLHDFKVVYDNSVSEDYPHESN